MSQRNLLITEDELESTPPTGAASGRMNGFRPQSPNPGGSESYEEFFSGTVPCPSCRGLGRIPKELEQQMVALIPINDKRLKPRRTTLYVCIAVGMCLLVGALLTFFLMPRSVTLSNNNKRLDPLEVEVNTTEQMVFLSIRNHYNITNHNFFAVVVTKLTMTVLFDTKILAQTTNDTALSVPMRSTRTHYIDVNVTFSGDEGYIAFYCSDTSKYGHTLLMPFDATATTSYLGHTEEAILTTYQHVRCSKAGAKPESQQMYFQPQPTSEIPVLHGEVPNT